MAPRMSINQRSRDVLSQVVTLHYRTCEPVGSTLISKTKQIPYSPATIRNILAHLEHCGFLQQPHTSAGRLPTDLGYRAYVDHLTLQDEALDQSECRHLSQELDNAWSGPLVLNTLAANLHQMTGVATFSLPFQHTGMRLVNLHFERINPDTLTAVWIGGGGQTYQKVLEVNEEEINRAVLEKVENYINARFSGLNLREIRTEFAKALGASYQWDLLVQKVNRLTALLEEKARNYDQLNFKGLTKLLEMPEFQDVARLKLVMRLIEEQTSLHRQIHRAVEHDDHPIVVFIGHENQDPSLESFTLVVAKINSQRDTLGCVGMIGPKRMPYKKSLRLLSFAKKRIADRDF